MPHNPPGQAKPLRGLDGRSPEERRLAKRAQTRRSWDIFQVRGMKTRLQTIMFRYDQLEAKAILVDLLDGLEDAIEASRPPISASTHERHRYAPYKRAVSEPVNTNPSKQQSVTASNSTKEPSNGPE